MEEKKNPNAAPQQKLTYEQLEAYATQMTGQHRQMQQEIMHLRQALDNANKANLYQEIHFAFKVVEFAHMFDDAFVKKVVNKLQELLEPVETPKEEAEPAAPAAPAETPASQEPKEE